MKQITKSEQTTKNKWILQNRIREIFKIGDTF